MDCRARSIFSTHKKLVLIALLGFGLLSACKMESLPARAGATYDRTQTVATTPVARVLLIEEIAVYGQRGFENRILPERLGKFKIRVATALQSSPFFQEVYFYALPPLDDRVDRYSLRLDFYPEEFHEIRRVWHPPGYWQSEERSGEVKIRLQVKLQTPDGSRKFTIIQQKEYRDVYYFFYNEEVISQTLAETYDQVIAELVQKLNALETPAS